MGLGEPGSGVVGVDTGPGVEAIGEVAGLRVLDLGSGLGRHAARPVALGAEVTAVDASQAQHQRALARYPGTPGSAWCAPMPSPICRKRLPTT
ncbi:class I SAM-dependent methyltransferase [Streptomyces wuyuanensis]|uniref:class I SAM-dependent methyltransferase n=1 Tax=Streptomyces wuyuanensis TaxID=1196353 RepID=UPI00115FDAFC|nr:hypothetical protein [Streptomyces wuyuanensis]